MPTKHFATITTGWTSGSNIIDDNDSTFGFITSQDGTPATKQETVEWASLIFSNYHFINLHVRYSIGLDVVAGGGPDTGSATVHLEYNSGAGFIDIVAPTTVGPTTENGDIAEIEATVQLIIAGDFDLVNLDVRGDVASSATGSGSGQADVNLHEVFVMVYADSAFGGFQPV